MPKKARRRRKILGFSANVIKPPLVFGRSETRGGGFFTGIGLISILMRKHFIKDETLTFWIITQLCKYTLSTVNHNNTF